MRSIAIGFTVLAACATASATGTPQVSPVSSTALVVTYADGRTSANAIGPAPRSFWTPAFPRVADWQPPAGGEKASALQVAFVLVGDDARVEISLLYGQPHSSETSVARTVVRRDQRVEIPELTKFGVQPITLSLTTIEPVKVEPPKVTIDFPGLEVSDVAVVPDAVPRYRVTVRNATSTAARAFSVATFADGRPALSGIQRGHDGTAVVLPGETYAFDIRSAGGRPGAQGTVAPLPFNLIRISNALWKDGSSSGSPKWGAEELAADLGERLQLEHVVAAVTQAMSDAARDEAGAARSLRAAIEALPAVPDDATIKDAIGRQPKLATLPPPEITSMCKITFQKVKTAILDDMQAFERTPPPAGTSVNRIRNWLKDLSGRYNAWLNQLSPH
jgi:hypothetical protein